MPRTLHALLPGVCLVLLGCPERPASDDESRVDTPHPEASGAERECPKEVTHATPRPKNLILVVVGTLRADHLALYGY